MTRSRRRTPIFGMTTAESDKPFKQREHRRERRAVRQNPEHPPPAKKFGNPWASDKDGHHWWAGTGKKDMRK